MKKVKKVIYEELLKLQNNPVEGRHLVVVDIQPEYISGFQYFFDEFVDFLNENYEKMIDITFLYNGYETIGMIKENEYKLWWFENGLKEDVIDMATFYDKGYAFFRYCIDEEIDEDTIVNMIKFMIEKNINDSRDMNEIFWDEFVERYGDKNIRELLEFVSDAINIPDLMDELKSYYNVIICGGGINECLKEVEIALQSLDKHYIVLSKYTY